MNERITNYELPVAKDMFLHSLKITGFRNLGDLHLEFDPAHPLIGFSGANGQGKTNILEAIFMLAISKSFRTRHAEDLIQISQPHFHLSAQVRKGEDLLTHELILMRSPEKKVLKINGVPKNALDYIGHFNAVFFSPDDIGMIHLAPALRRQYLDLLLSQFDREYLGLISQYKEVIRQRNALLKQIDEGRAKEPDLEFWDRKIVELGIPIVQKRQELIEELNAFVGAIYQGLTQNRDRFKISYLASVNPQESAEVFLNFLVEGRRRDIAHGSTQWGPHRDDIRFFCNDCPMASFASRGEWRSVVLALKFAEVELLKKKSGFYPVLLLDDVFSELDAERQRYLFGIIKNAQTFITTTHREFFDLLGRPARVYEVEEGRVNKKFI